MGMPSFLVDMILDLKQKSGNFGDVLSIARQTIHISEQEFQDRAAQFGIPLIHRENNEQDNTRFADAWGIKSIRDDFFWTSLGSTYTAIDVTDYEGAQIVHDLSTPIPERLDASFDLIFEGSCLDNIFNPAQAIINLSRMLRSGGKIILLNHYDSFNGPYLTFSPQWFTDYFTINNYSFVQTYLAVFTDNEDLHRNKLPIFACNPLADITTVGLAHGRHALVVVFAEKSERSSNSIMPVQRQYRSVDMEKRYKEVREGMSKKPVPVYAPTGLLDGQQKSGAQVNWEKMSGLVRCF